MDQPADAIEETLWRYVRGDLDEAAFEAWVYATPDLEAVLGPQDFFAVISCDYRDKSGHAHHERVGMARDIVTRHFPRGCVCRSIPDADRQNPGAGPCPLEDHLDVIAQRSPCIRFVRCRACDTHWLIGYDSEDDWASAHRVSAEAVDDILIRDRWPTVFDNSPNFWPRSRYQIIRDYDEAIRRNPKDADAYFSLGICYVGKEGDNAKAFYNFDQAVLLRQDLAWPFARRGDCYVIMGDIDAALRDYDRAIALDNNQYASSSARYGRAGLHLQRSNFGQAIADYDRVLDALPGYAAAFMERGMAHAGLGHFDRAIGDFDRAVELARGRRLEPVPVAALYNRAKARLMAGDELGANADLAAARAVDADLVDSWAAIDLPTP